MIKKLVCWVVGHDYFLIKKLTRQSRKLGCRRCNKCFGMNDDVRAVIDWDQDCENMYELMGVDTK